MKKQSFIKGTIILIIANTISKILGAVFKIPLAYILEEEGMGIFSASFGAYIMLLSFVTSGIPLAISKKTAEYSAENRLYDISSLIRSSEILMFVLGGTGSLILFLGADIFALFLNDPKTALSIRLISPSIFFVALASVYKSYFQGIQNMTPTAVSEVIEAAVKLIFGYMFAVMLAPKGTALSSGGAILGITIGEGICTLILWLTYLLHKHPKSRAKFSIIKNILAFAFPLILTSGISGFISMIDVSTIRVCLERMRFSPESAQNFLSYYKPFTDIFDNITETLKMSKDGAGWLYGAYSGYAMTVFHLPVGILGIFGVSVLPVVSSSIALNNHKKAEKIINTAMRTSMIIAMPCFVILLLLSSEILSVLFKNTASSLILSCVSPCIIATSVIVITNAALQASGHIFLPFYHMLWGSIAKFALNFILISNPRFNILGCCIASAADLSIIAILNMLSVRKYLGVHYSLSKIFLKPLISSAVMGFILFGCKNFVYSLTSNNILNLALIISLSAIAYFMMILLTGAVTADDFLTVFNKKYKKS